MAEGAGEFLGREIEVVTEGVPKTPLSFRLGSRDYRVAEILETWQDHGFGSVAPLRKNWRLRHHRNYYRLRTDEGEVFEIYYDRGGSLRHPERRKWYARRKL